MLDRSGVPGIPCAASFDVPRHPRCFRSSFTEDSLVPNNPTFICCLILLYSAFIYSHLVL